MAQDRAPDARKGNPPKPPPEETQETELDDEKAARALDEIENLRRKLEPRG